jgi:CRISPR-associated protein Cmr4
MPSTTRIYRLHVLTPTHVGTGRGIGYIDLPIHRDKTTGWPLVPGSAFTGVRTDNFRASEEKRKKEDALRLAFGIADDTNYANGSNAGALVPTDARIVCLPVRSFQGTFAWCTSRMALHLLKRDLELAGYGDLPPLPSVTADDRIGVDRTACALKVVLEADPPEKVFLEDMDFTIEENSVVSEGY